MRAKVFNTRFELSLRSIILLCAAGRPLDLESLCAADFVATYGKAFSIADENINGDNRFMFIEFMTRRSIIQAALKELVLKGYVLPVALDGGFAYKPTAVGLRYASSLEGDYANAYKTVVISAIDYVEEKTARAVIEEISRRAEHIKEA